MSLSDHIRSRIGAARDAARVEHGCKSCASARKDGAPPSREQRDSSDPVMLAVTIEQRRPLLARRALSVAIAAALVIGSVGILLTAFDASRPFALRVEPVVTRILPPTVAPGTAIAGEGVDEEALVGAIRFAERRSIFCSIWAPPTGTGRVTVTIEPTGRPSRVELDAGAFQGTEVGRCVERAFYDLVVPPFEGPAAIVRRDFRVR